MIQSNKNTQKLSLRTLFQKGNKVKELSFRTWCGIFYSLVRMPLKNPNTDCHADEKGIPSGALRTAFPSTFFSKFTWAWCGIPRRSFVALSEWQAGQYVIPIKEASHPEHLVLLFQKHWWGRFVNIVWDSSSFLCRSFGMIPSEFLIKIPRGQAKWLWIVIPHLMNNKKTI